MIETPLKGQILEGRFEIGDQLENRGYGALYDVFDRQNNGARLLLRNIWNVHGEAHQRFYREQARVIQHELLPETIDLIFIPSALPSEGTGCCRILSWTRGVRLEEHVLQSEPISIETAVSIITQVCIALEYLHAYPLPFIHKHVSPANIVWSRDQQNAILRDYGLSEIGAQFLDDAQIILRSSSYIAPEVWGPQNAATPATDVYSVGATLYYLLARQPPVSAVHRIHYSAPLTPVYDINPNVPRSIVDVISRAMELDPSRRYPTALAFQTALEEAIVQRHAPINIGNGRGIGDGSGVIFWFIIPLLIAVVFFAVRDDTPSSQQPVMPTDAAVILPIVPDTPLPPTATPDPAATLAAFETTTVLVFGPEDGTLSMPAPGLVGPRLTGQMLADADVSAVFTNPQTPGWDYGFAFRYDPGSHFRAYVASDGRWQIDYREESPLGKSTLVGTGPATGLHLNPGESNRLRLVVAGELGFLFVNEQSVGTVYVPNKAGAGDVVAATGLAPEVVGQWVMTYSELTISAPTR